MLDTVKLRSPYLPEQVAQRIEEALMVSQRFRPATGELAYSITADSLLGSWDTRVHVRLWREEFKASAPGTAFTRPIHRSARKTVEVRSVPSPPYVVIEGSVHKALLGHNVTGGPRDFAAPVRWLVADLAARMAVELPDGLSWLVEQADWAECYRVSWDAAQEFIGTLALARFPRRKVSAYGQESIMVPGTTTALKIYHKGPEFTCHDRKRLRLFLEPFKLDDLQQLANGIIRVETAVKSKKLQLDFGHKPQVGEVTPDYLQRVHDLEVTRLLKEARTDMEQVRTAHEVKRRLADLYPTTATQLYGLWITLATLGEQEARQDISRRTYYRHKKQLTEAGCSWHGTDVILRERSAIPADFSLTRGSLYRVQAEDARIVCQLASYRHAA